MGHKSIIKLIYQVSPHLIPQRGEGTHDEAVHDYAASCWPYDTLVSQG